MKKPKRDLPEEEYIQEDLFRVIVGVDAICKFLKIGKSTLYKHHMTHLIRLGIIDRIHKKHDPWITTPYLLNKYIHVRAKEKLEDEERLKRRLSFRNRLKKNENGEILQS